MGKNTSRNKKGKKTTASAIITFLMTIIVIIATLLGYGGEENETVTDNTNGNHIASEVVAEADSDIEDEEVETAEEGGITEDSEIVSEEKEVESEVSSEVVSESDIWDDITVAEVTFRSQKLLDQHYEKHGIEMGFASAEEYELAAYKVIIHPDTLHKIESEDGDDVYYREETNEFVVVSQDGYIRTYFNPSAGLDYYNRQ